MLRPTNICTLFIIVSVYCACSKPASIEVEPAQPLLKSKDESIQLRVIVKDQAGEVMNRVAISYKSMTPTMATVDSAGLIKPVTSGTAAILVTADGVSKEVEVLVQLPKKIAIEPNNPMLMLGVTRGFKATVYNDRDQPMLAGEIHWSTSDPQIFTVDKQGNVTTKEEGEATLTVDAAGIRASTKVLVKHEELQEDGRLRQ